MKNRPMKLNDYENGIAYATGIITKENGKSYLIVRNLEKWYVENIAKATGYNMYTSDYFVERDRRLQWVVKARNIHELPKLSEINNTADFCRAYIELHGIIDVQRPSYNYHRLRLRIYGKEEIISFLNEVLPAKEKKIQFIKNCIDKNYVGETCALYYQSKGEICDILDWIDGEPKNTGVWNKWKSAVDAAIKKPQRKR